MRRLGSPRSAPARDEPDVIPDYLKNYKGPRRFTNMMRPEDFLLGDDQVDIEEVRAALSLIDPDPRETWLSVGMALHDIDAWEEWIAWSKGSSKFDQKDAARVWRSFSKREDGVGVGTLFHIAKQQGWRQARKGKAMRRRDKAEHDLEAAEALDDGVITQDGVALIFAERYAGKLKFCHSTGAWFEWDGSRWRRNDEDVAFQYARTLGREASEGEKANVRKEVRKVAFAGAVERFARGDARLSTTADRWDADPWLLGTPGGTVNLRTGELLPAAPADDITKLAAVAPAQDEDCPLWKAFLRETFQGNVDEVAFVKSWSGYCLTGDVYEHALLFGHGAGGNGKSVLASTLAGIMGEYAATAPMDMFLDQQYRGHPTELADLHGRRLITAQEVEPNQVWSQVRITSLTGGDKVKARFMRQDFFEFSPQFKLMFMGNDKPGLKTVNDAIRRRVNLLPFNHKPAKVDPRLGEKLKGEWPGILRWMINGCLEWQAHGLQKPQSVKDATESYLVSEDLLLMWLEECCIIEPEEKRAAHDKAEGYKGPKTRRSELFASWRDFCNRMRRPPGEFESALR